MSRSIKCRFLAAFFSLFTLVAIHSAHAEEVVVYSARIEQLIKPMFDAFTKETGIKVKYTTDNEGALLARLEAEGKNTPADMLITADAGNLWAAAQAGLLKPVKSDVLESNIPAHLRDPANEWFGLSIRARTLILPKAKPEELSTTKIWRIRNGASAYVCARLKVHNQRQPL